MTFVMSAGQLSSGPARRVRCSTEMPDGLPVSALTLARAAPQRHCIDCPALRAGCLHALIGQSSAECRFETLTVEARAPFVLRPDAGFRLALVRRGVLLRERGAVAVDVVGAGSAFFIEAGTCTGYAVTRTLLCLCPEPALGEALQASGLTGLELHELGMRALVRVERLSAARARSDAAQRLAALLCVLADTLAASSCLPDGIQQRDLARLSCLRPESVCRALRQLSAGGSIRQGADGIEIVDRTALEAQSR